MTGQTHSLQDSVIAPGFKHCLVHPAENRGPGVWQNLSTTADQISKNKYNCVRYILRDIFSPGTARTARVSSLAPHRTTPACCGQAAAGSCLRWDADAIGAVLAAPGPLWLGTPRRAWACFCRAGCGAEPGNQLCPPVLVARARQRNPRLF